MPEPTLDKQQAPTTQPATSAPPRPSDSFEKSGVGKPGASASGPLPGKENGAQDLLKMARESPQTAARIIETLATQTKTLLGEIEREMAGAKAVLQTLVNERFSKTARDKVAQELRQKREKLQQLKSRYHLGTRKMALLQQVAGRLSHPDLEEELDKLLGKHNKLKTAWGKRHHLLSIGELLFGDDDETPEHLREVVPASVRAGPRGDDVADAMGEVSPRRVIAELIARTLDGSERDTQAGADPNASQVTRGDFGKALQNYALLSESLDKSLSNDPLNNPSKKGT